jgi:lipopolysaccharide export system protein LptA
MRAGGGVVAGLTLAADSGHPERRLELGGANLVYSALDRTLFVTDQCFAAVSGARLEGGEISAVIAPEGGTVVSLTARTGVAVSKGEYVGRAEAASYDPRTGLLVLTGRPVLTDGKGGAARGVKLTFDLADDKILIENEGSGRSTTVIRS